jgi:glycosyltransferase involved in cell wall biosynthesis
MQFDDAQRDEFVRHAAVLLLPSLHEGFGRTALEAMSAGVPVIASNRGAIPEVVGEAGLLLDPYSKEEWVKAIVGAFEGQLDGSKGPAQAARFSWDQTAGIILAKLPNH